MACKVQQSLKDRLLHQLSEVEIISSIYPLKGEFELEDPTLISTWRNFVDSDEGSEEEVTKGLSFVLKLEYLEVLMQIPLDYPYEYPDVLVRSPSLNKDMYIKMMTDLKTFMQLTSDEICFSTIIDWLKENIEHYQMHSPNPQKTALIGHSSSKGDVEHFSRLWIYSHHIYSTSKRKLIVHTANDLNLSGFCMPGKPGIIVVEGMRDNVDQFWTTVHSLQWKKITVREREDFIAGKNDEKLALKFDSFKENYFISDDSHHAHSDRGILYRFLAEKDCTHAFYSLFGLEDKSSEVINKKD